MVEVNIKINQHNKLKNILDKLTENFGFYVIEIDEFDLMHIDNDRFELHQFMDHITIKYK